MAATACDAEADGARAPAPGWLGALELGFRPRAGRTVLGHRRHQGPFLVQSPFYPEGAPCHVYLLHPPGGMVGGDGLRLDALSAPGSHAVITTPAAAKFYRSAGPEARVDQRLRVEAGAVLEFLPTEAIVFDGARANVSTRLELETGARLLAWDAWVLGRPACGEVFATGMLRQDLELSVDGRALLWERNRVAGDSAWLRAPWGLGGRPAWATLLAWPGDAAALEQARGGILGSPAADAAATLVDGVLVCRVVAGGLVALRRQLERWWRVLRPLLLGREAVAPRIWAT